MTKLQPTMADESADQTLALIADLRLRFQRASDIDWYRVVREMVVLSKISLPEMMDLGDTARCMQ